MGEGVGRVFVSLERMVWGQGWVTVGILRVLLHLLALWPFFLQWKQSPSLIHLALSVGVSLEREMASMSMVLGSWVVQGE